MQMTSFLGDFNLDWSSVVLSIFDAAGSGTGMVFDLSFIHCATKSNAYLWAIVCAVAAFLALMLPMGLISG